MAQDAKPNAKHEFILKEMDTMSSTNIPFRCDEGFRALDPDLPFLAAEVAIDIDNLLAGRSDSRTAMSYLANILSQSVEPPSPQNVDRSRMDMATLTVLGEAIAGTVDIQALHKVDDLLAKARAIAHVLANADPVNNREELTQAEAFCVALSKFAAAYSESIRDLGPSYPYRR